MNVLGIETSCDETGVALYSTEQGLLADALHSQVDLHAVYGGVVPEIASRDHVRRLLPLIRQVLRKETVAAYRSDSILIKDLREKGIETLILSSEVNPVVAETAVCRSS